MSGCGDGFNDTFTRSTCPCVLIKCKFLAAKTAECQWRRGGSCAYSGGSLCVAFILLVKVFTCRNRKRLASCDFQNKISICFYIFLYCPNNVLNELKHLCPSTFLLWIFYSLILGHVILANGVKTLVCLKNYNNARKRWFLVDQNECFWLGRGPLIMPRLLSSIYNYIQYSTVNIIHTFVAETTHSKESTLAMSF